MYHLRASNRNSPGWQAGPLIVLVALLLLILPARGAGGEGSVGGDGVVDPPEMKDSSWLGAAGKSIDLPGPVTEMAVADNGHMVCFYSHALEAVALFDVAKQAVVGSISTTNEDGTVPGVVRIAAGGKRLLILKDGAKIERWNLATRKLEANGTLAPLPNTFYDCIAMGADNALLAMVHCRREAGMPRGTAPHFLYLDTTTFRPKKVQEYLTDNEIGLQGFQLSSNGETFTVASKEMQAGYFDGNNCFGLEPLKNNYYQSAWPMQVPSHDGRLIFFGYNRTNDRENVQALDLKQMAPPKIGQRGVPCTIPPRTTIYDNLWIVPAPSAPFFVGLIMGLHGLKVVGVGRLPRFDSVYNISNLDIRLQEFATATSLIRLDQRVQFFPEDKVLMVLPNDSQVVLHPLDPALAMAPKNKFFTISPVTGANPQANKPFKAHLNVQNAQGQVILEFNSSGSTDRYFLDKSGNFEVPAESVGRHTFQMRVSDETHVVVTQTVEYEVLK